MTKASGKCAGLSANKALHRRLWDLCTASADMVTGGDEGAAYAGPIKKYKQFVVPRVRFQPNTGSDRVWQLTFRYARACCTRRNPGWGDLDLCSSLPFVMGQGISGGF